MKEFAEHPTHLLGLLWAFWFCVAVIIPIPCIPLSFYARCTPYTYRISRTLLWGTIPLTALFVVGSFFESQGSQEDWLIGFGLSVFSGLLPLIPFVLSRRKLKRTMSAPDQRAGAE